MRSKCDDCGHNIIRNNQKVCDYGVFLFPDTPGCIYYYSEEKKARLCKNCSIFIKNKNNCKLNTKNKMPENIKECWLFTTDDNKIKELEPENSIQKRLEAI